MKKYLYLMRVHHYIKNILIFMPLIFSGNLTDRRKFMATLLGMIAFSLVTSAVYVINDIGDAEKDRMHPTKKKRPIASGAVTPVHAVILMAVILIVAMEDPTTLTIPRVRMPLCFASLSAARLSAVSPD